MKKLLIIPLICLGCANVRYTHTATDGSKTETSATSVFSTTALKGMVVDGNGKNRDSAGMRLTGVATDPNSAAITATGDALGALVGQAIATGGKAIVP